MAGKVNLLVAKLSRISMVWFGASLAATLAAAGIATASTTGIFGGGDSGIQHAAGIGVAVGGGAYDTHLGVTATVTGAVADDTRTVIGLSFSGREAEGAGVFPLGQAQLVDQEGRIYQEVGGSSDQENLRLVTRTFPPLDVSSRSIQVQINGITLLNRGVNPTDGVHLNSQWVLRVDLPNGPARSVDVSIGEAARPLGLGGIAMDRVQQAPTGTVFSGHLVGFSMDQIPELGFQAWLVGADGNAQPFIGLRLGYGPNRERFEVRFSPTVGQATLRMLPIVSPHPHDDVAAQSLEGTLSGAVAAEWPVALPK